MGNQQRAEQIYRWKPDCSGMEYKCPECGNWDDMDNASSIYFGDASRPACSDCYQKIMTLVKSVEVEQSK